MAILNLILYTNFTSNNFMHIIFPLMFIYIHNTLDMGCSWVESPLNYSFTFEMYLLSYIAIGDFRRYLKFCEPLTKPVF